MSNSNMPPKNDSASINSKEAEKQAEDSDRAVLDALDTEVKQALQYIGPHNFPKTRPKFLNLCENNFKLRKLPPAILENIWTALQSLKSPQTALQDIQLRQTTNRRQQLLQTTRAGKWRNFLVESYKQSGWVKGVQDSALKSRGEQRVDDDQVEMEPTRKKPRLDFDRGGGKKLNENKYHSAPVSGHHWTHNSTEPRRTNFISSRKDKPCL